MAEIYLNVSNFVNILMERTAALNERFFIEKYIFVFLKKGDFVGNDNNDISDKLHIARIFIR